MKKLIIKNQKGFSYHILMPIFVIAVIAVIGTLILTRSHAATSSYLGFANYASVSNYSATGVFESQDDPAGLGAQYVADIPPNNVLIYNNFPATKITAKQICYYLRVFNSPKASVQLSQGPVQIVGYGNQQLIYVPTDNNYHKLCISSGTSPQLSYNVKNFSPYTYVLVYQAIYEY